MGILGIFDLKIMNPDRIIFEGEISNLFVQGDTGEFEILPYHYPVLSLLREGTLIIDWKYSLPVKKGVLRFFKNACVVLVEMHKEGRKG